MHTDTKKLFIQRELEREFKDIKRFDKLNLKVHEKHTATSIDRAGTIRMLNDIPALRPDGQNRGRNRKVAASVDNVALLGSPKQVETARHKKLNIFNENSQVVLRGGNQESSPEMMGRS